MQKLILNLKTLTCLLLTLAVAFTQQSCTKDTCTESYSYTAQEPQFMSFKTLRNTVIKATTPTDLEKPGKIYFKEPYLFVNELNKGIHVIDNSDAANPQNIAFIEIPGNVDIAVKGNTLYADSYTDLLSIDISNPLAINLKDRELDVFRNNYGYYSDTAFITHYEKVEHVTQYPCNEQPPQQNQPVWWSMEGDVIMTNAPAQTNTAGTGGSMARFAIVNNYLYAVSMSELKAFNIATATNPQLESTQYIGWNIETIFPYNNHLFVGSQTQMQIFSLQTPNTPTEVGVLSHANSCDPIVVEGNYAYITLRTGNTCNQGVNELRIVNVEDYTNPILLKTYPMTNPHGLGIDNGTLFICDGADGLKIYDATDINTLDQKQIAHYPNINTFDIIPKNKVAMLIGEDGLFQYDYSNLKNVKLLSKIAIVKK